MYSGHSAQNSAVRAAAAGVSSKRAKRHAKNGTAAESTHHSTAPAHSPARSVPNSVMGTASNMWVPGGKNASYRSRSAPMTSRWALATYPPISEYR